MIHAVQGQGGGYRQCGVTDRVEVIDRVGATGRVGEVRLCAQSWMAPDGSW